MESELTKKFNEAMQAAVFDQNSKCKNEVYLSNDKPIDKDLEEDDKKIIEELRQKILEADRWYNEQARKNVPAIILDSHGRYAGSCGTASFLDYIEGVKNKQVKIHDKKYKKSILKLIKNNK